jgi:SagB-type dehydrogenase family enzyme
MRIQTSYGVRLRPPSRLIGAKWVVEDHVRHRAFAVSATGAMLLVGCMRPIERSDVIAEVVRLTHNPDDIVRRIVQELERRALIEVAIDEQDSKAIKTMALRDAWSRHGWTEAAEYQVATLDYVFHGGDTDGSAKARERMRGYAEAEPDFVRAKVCSGAEVRVEAPRPDADLLPRPISTVWQPAVRSDLTGDVLLEVMSMTLGQIGCIGAHWNGAPVIRRTSPSGGGRHPTEGYVAVANVPGLECGWYHFATQRCELEMVLKEHTGATEMEQAFPMAWGRCPFAPRAVVVLTCVFERNMFRYREPRTFRSVHMDAGHLAATLEICATAAGAQSFIQYAANERNVETKLGLHALDEGFQLSVALG